MYRLLGVLDSDPLPARDRVLAWESHPDLAARRHGIARRAAEMGFEGPSRIEPDRYAQAISGILLPTAELEIEAGEYARATRAIDRYLERFPESGHAYYLKAEVHRHTLPEGRQSTPAREAYERAVQLAPDDPDALRALGFLLRETGETERAR
jgi:tetratricopeptide (TPR) repeat protein